MKIEFFEDGSPLFTDDYAPETEELVKTSEAFQALLEFVTALGEGRVKSVSAEAVDPDVKEVIDTFNEFIANGVDPVAVMGYVRMNIPPETLQKAEPILHEMIVRGVGYIHIPAGAIPCHELMLSVRKSTIKPSYVLASSECGGCVYNVKSNCSKVGLPIQSIPEVTDEGLDKFAAQVSSKYAHLAPRVREILESDDSLNGKFGRIIEALVAQTTRVSSEIHTDYVDLVGSLRDSDLRIREKEQELRSIEGKLELHGDQGEVAGVEITDAGSSVDAMFKGRS